MTGTGKYAGTKTITFKIIPKKMVISKVTVGKKQIKPTWAAAKAAQKITGYQIRYAVKGTSKWKTKNVSAKLKSLTIKKLKKSKAYQVQIRAYKKVSGKTYYGSWSKVKTSKKVK